jgi:hypothetical protein
LAFLWFRTVWIPLHEGSRTRSYFFGPLTMIVIRIHGMISNGYFSEGMGNLPGEEIVPEPKFDEAVVFEELFTADLRMPPQPVLPIFC